MSDIKYTTTPIYPSTAFPESINAQLRARLVTNKEDNPLPRNPFQVAKWTGSLQFFNPMTLSEIKEKLEEGQFTEIPVEQKIKEVEGIITTIENELGTELKDEAEAQESFSLGRTEVAPDPPASFQEFITDIYSEKIPDTNNSEDFCPALFKDYEEEYNRPPSLAKVSSAMRLVAGLAPSALTYDHTTARGVACDVLVNALLESVELEGWIRGGVGHNWKIASMDERLYVEATFYEIVLHKGLTKIIAADGKRAQILFEKLTKVFEEREQAAVETPVLKTDEDPDFDEGALFNTAEVIGEPKVPVTNATNSFTEPEDEDDIFDAEGHVDFAKVFSTPISNSKMQEVPIVKDDATKQSEEKDTIQYLKSVQGRVLTVLEAAFSSTEQREAVKTLIRKEFRREMNKVNNTIDDE
jgi:hypothetical protein